jgi:hypothetical protein
MVEKMEHGKKRKVGEDNCGVSQRRLTKKKKLRM